MPGLRAGHFVLCNFILCDAQGTHPELAHICRVELHHTEPNSFLAVGPCIEIPKPKHEDNAMKFRTAILAAALVATSGYAFAQNTTTPADQNRPGMQGDDSSKQKDTMGNKGAGNTTGSMAPATTGSGTSPAKDTMDKNVSPASPKAGESQPAK
jgi:hypothetical protein